MKKITDNKWLNFKIFSVKIVYLAILTILVIILSMLNPSMLNPSLFVIFIISIFILYICAREVTLRKDRINELSLSVDMVLKDSLDLIDIPMVMMGSSTEIIWQNSVSKHLLPKDYIIDASVKVCQSLKQSSSASTTLGIGNGETYTAIANKIKFANFDCILISFINKTEEFKLKETLENTKTAVGIIFIDNYDETMQGLDEMQKAEISSKITKELINFVSSNKGVISKVDKDRYIVFIEKQYVEQIEANTFEILERVRNISDKTKLPITVSIGISYSEQSIDERYKASTAALDIALGRGGDQAVVKKDKKFDFYGGSNIGLEKTSRVRSRTVAQALKEIIERVDKVYIIGHKSPDIDCIGAAVGIYKIAKSLEKETNIIIDAKCNSSTKSIIDKVKSSGEYEDVFVFGSELKKQDYSNSLLVVVDTHKKSYVSYPDFVDNFEKIVVIDHHRRGPEFIDNALLTYHEIYASSASELVAELLMYLDNISLTPIEAECLYAGIVIDTKNFIFKTGVRTFEVAAYLKKYGIDLTEVKQLFQNDFETYVTKVEIVKNAEIIKGKIAISVTEEPHKEMGIIAAQAADELLSISGILASFVLCKIDDVVMISGRSMGDINVQSILEKIGGGGHLTFAGAQIAGISVDEAKSKLLASINDYFGKD